MFNISKKSIIGIVGIGTGALVTGAIGYTIHKSKKTAEAEIMNQAKEITKEAEDIIKSSEEVKEEDVDQKQESEIKTEEN